MKTEFIFPQLDIELPEEVYEDIGGFLPKAEVKSYIKTELENIRNDSFWQMGKKHFKNEDGTDWEMSPGELAIFKAIILRPFPRVQITSSTQYGKTLTVSRGLLERICTWPEEWMVVVPDLKRGQILLNYIIKDTYNHNYFRAKLVGKDIAEKTALNRLLEEKSKVKLTYQVVCDDGQVRYGSVEIISCEAKRKNDVINTIMGFGGRNVIQEEASLEDDEIDSGIFRMLAGKGEDTFLCKIGNPFYRNHFFKSWKDKRYKKVFIDYRIGMLEGRYLPDFIDEAREKPNFEVLYECRFPSEDQIDTEGWTPLITESELKDALTDDFNPFGAGSLGADPADTGENESVVVVRWRNVAKIDFASNKIDVLEFCGKISDAIDKNKIDVRTGSADKIGVGAAVPAEMKRIGKPIQGVNVGEACDTPEHQAQFTNKKAEFAWAVREWIKGGGKLLRDNRWYQLLNIKYREDTKRRLVIMSKKDMIKKGIKSPDAFDALALTFARPQIFYTKTLEEDFFQKKMLQQTKKNQVSKNKPFKMTGY